MDSIQERTIKKRRWEKCLPFSQLYDTQIADHKHNKEVREELRIK